MTAIPTTDATVSDDPRKPILKGLVALGLFFGVIGTWAATAPLDSAAVATGVVKVEGNRKTVQHLDGGIIKEILVKEGDLVARGQVLLRLDDVQARAAVEVLANQYDAARALEARLLTEQADARAIAFPADLLGRAADPKVAELVGAQTNLFAARKQAIVGQVDVLNQRIRQQREQIAGLEAQQAAQKRQRDLIVEELAGTRELYEKGYAPKTRVLALERAAANLQGQEGEYAGNVAKLRQGIGEAELQIVQLRKNMLSEVSGQLTEVQEKLADISERLTAARDVLARTEVTAPEAGYVVGLTTFTVGGVINRSDKILDIVPSDSAMVIEAMMPPEDVDDVQPGMEAHIQLTAFKRRITPSVGGTVRLVSADRLTDQRTGMGYYKVEVEVDQNDLATIEGAFLAPGMPAEVMIPTSARTALDYFIAPLYQSISRAGREK